MESVDAVESVDLVILFQHFAQLGDLPKGADNLPAAHGCAVAARSLDERTTRQPVPRSHIPLEPHAQATVDDARHVHGCRAEHEPGRAAGDGVEPGPSRGGLFIVRGADHGGVQGGCSVDLLQREVFHLDIVDRAIEIYAGGWEL